MKRRVPRFCCLACVAVVALYCGGCDSPAPALDAGTDAAPMFLAPTCAGSDEAPLRLPDGSHVCTRVGASEATAAGEWPDVSRAAAPVVYVRPGGDGDGSLVRPFGTLSAALAASPRAATIALSRGAHALSATVEITRAVDIVGAGAGASVVEAPAGASALSVVGSGDSIAVSLSGITVRAPVATGEFGVVGVEGSARCSLRDVIVEGGSDGLRADRGATVCAEGVSVRTAGRRGVALLGGSQGFLRGVSVRDGAGVGVLSDRSHLTLERALVASNGRDGVAMRGAWLGAICSTDAGCAAPSPCPGFELARACAAGVVASGPRYCRSENALTDVASLRNRVTGARAARTTPTADEIAAGQRDAVLSWPGPMVLGERLIIAGTRAIEGAPGGDGLYVGPGATVALDPSASSDAERGLASEIVANERTGVLADGDRSVSDGGVPDRLRQGARLVLAGARVASNGGPGVFVQERAFADRLAFVEVADNGALGLGVTSGGGVALMICDRFISTRMGTITPEDRSVQPFVVGDGVSLAQGSGAGARLRVVDSEFSRNARFGVVLDGFDATLDDGSHGGNRGDGNAFGVGVYGTASVNGSSPLGAIRGRTATAPVSAPTVRDSVTPAGG